MNKLSKDIKRYTMALVKYLEEYEEATNEYNRTLEAVKTKHAEWRVRMKRKGCDIHGFLGGSIGFDPVKHPGIVKRRLLDFVEHSDEWSTILKETT